MLRTLWLVKGPLGLAPRSLLSRNLLHSSAVASQDNALGQRPDLGASPLFGSADSANTPSRAVEAPIKAQRVKAAGPTSISAQTDTFRYSHKKFRFMASQVAQTKVSDALLQLEHHPRKKAAKHVFSALLHAQREASRHHGIRNEDAYIEQAWVGKGPCRKRIRIHGRGRMGMMTLPTTHMKFLIGPAPPANAEGGDLSGYGQRRKINGWKETKKVWMSLADKPIYNPKPYYNW